MESLTFFGVSMEYFGISEGLFERWCSFHFGDMMEFSPDFGSHLLDKLALLTYNQLIHGNRMPNE